MQALFQWNELTHDVDLFFLHCRQIDFATSSYRFQAPQILCRGTGSPSSRLLLHIFFFGLFFSFPTDTDPKSGSVFHRKRNKKGGGLNKFKIPQGKGISCSSALINTLGPPISLLTARGGLLESRLTLAQG